MKHLTISLLTLLMSMGAWSKDCFKGSPIIVQGKLTWVQASMSDFDLGKIYLLKTEDTECFDRGNVILENSDGNEIQLILSEDQEKQFEELHGKKITVSTKYYYEGLTRYHIRLVSFQEIELLAVEE